MRKLLLSIILILLLSDICYAERVRVCVENKTGKLIEMQSGEAPLGTLTQNAIIAGYKKDDVTEKYITQEEWKVIKTELDKPTPEQIYEVKVQAKMQEILRKQAIDELAKTDTIIK